MKEIGSSWQEHAKKLEELLVALSFRVAGEEVDPEDGFEQWLTMALELRERKGTIYLVGNGASASMASHMAADLAKNGQLHTEVFSDLSLITAVANDMGYSHVFAEPLRRRAREGDMLVAISSSGKSPNVLKAVEVAREAGSVVVTLSAMDADNPLRAAGSLNIYVPATTYGFAETAHAAVLHHWMDLVQQTG